MKYNNWLVAERKCLMLMLFAFLSASSSAFAGFVAPGDSVGSEVVGGKTFVLYRVEPKETLFSISNQYGISVAELVKHNPETEAGLKVGAVLRVPFAPALTADGNFHVVEKSETLYSIGRKYNVTVAQLKEWNNFSTDALSLGDRIRVSAPAQTSQNQNIGRPAANTVSGVNSAGSTFDYAGKIVHTVESKETLYSIARMHDTTEDKIKEWNNLPSNNISIGQKLIVGTTQGVPSGAEGERFVRNSVDEEKPKDYRYNTNPISITQIGDPSQDELVSTASSGPAENVRKITELGMAVVIDDTVNTKKYLALHRSAPIGTIMQVHNEMNNLSVFVRVVGKLPPTGDNDKVLIKLSRKAFDKLGAYNEKFPVRLTYVP